MAEDKEVVSTSSCASCGIAEIDDVKSTKCANCDLVRYCSEECQREHKSDHEACKKRAAELRDEILFKQPESTHLGDCPICFLPLPLDISKSSCISCCSKIICNGCYFTKLKREAEASLDPYCPFCREPMIGTENEREKRRLKREEANDPVALRNEGVKQCNKGDYKSAFEYFIKAAELGNVEAHYKLAIMYHDGHGVEKDDKGKEVHHLEEAAIGGHPEPRS